MNVAFLCPGQGSQLDGYLHRLPDHPQIHATLDEAGAALQMDMGQVDQPQALQSTIMVQVGIVVAGVAMARALQAEGVYPDVVAGLSVGAFTAAVIAGCLQFGEALRVVLLRAQAMAAAYPSGYGMVAISGLGESAIEDLIARINASRPAGDRAYLANLNSPSQFVVSGSDGALCALQDHARIAGARSVERLAVPVPSHSVLLRGVANRLHEALSQVCVRDPGIPYVANSSARLLSTAQDIAHDLAQSVMQPVRWHDASVSMVERGVRLFVELPPNRVLTRLAANLSGSVEAIAADGMTLRSLVIRAQRAKQGRDPS